MADLPYFAHETAVIDQPCTIGRGTKIWHFSHIMTECTIGEDCNIGQNVVISPQVVLGDRVKVQNNVSVYTGVTCDDEVFLGPSVVFTNVLNPRSGVNRRGEYTKTARRAGSNNRSQRDDRLWSCDRSIRLCRSRFGRDERGTSVRPGRR